MVFLYNYFPFSITFIIFIIHSSHHMSTYNVNEYTCLFSKWNVLRIIEIPKFLVHVHQTITYHLRSPLFDR